MFLIIDLHGKILKDINSHNSHVSQGSFFLIFKKIFIYLGFPGGSDDKVSAYNAGDVSSIPGSRRSPVEGNGTTLQYSCLENPMDRGAWWATVHGVTKSPIQLSN